MNLTVQERFALLGVLPNQGDILVAKRVRELRETLGDFTEEEEAQFNFRNELQCSVCSAKEYVPFKSADMPKCPICENAMQPTGMLWWNREANQDTEVEISPPQLSIIVKKLEELNARSQLDFAAGQDRLYEKFIEGGKDGKTD